MKEGGIFSSRLAGPGGPWYDKPINHIGGIAMDRPVFCPADLLLPAAAPLEEWAVIACDQFSSQPAY